MPSIIELSHHYLFKPLQVHDLIKLCTWFKKPHVKEWWNDHLSDDEIKAKYQKRIGSKIIVSYIFYVDEKPIGFIQYYFANKVGLEGWPSEADDTVGIDLFIGEEAYINHGYGTKMIKAFVDKLFSELNIHKILVDVDPENKRAQRCYEKVGFVFVKKVMTTDGLVNLFEMKRDIARDC